MEEKSIISLGEEIKESGVLVERNKSRERKRILRYFKRLFALIVLACLCVLAVLSFPYIKDFAGKIKLPSSLKDIVPNVTDTPPNANSSTNTSTDENLTPPRDYEYEITDIDAQDYIFVNESGCEFDTTFPYEKESLEEIYNKYGNEAPVVLIIHSNIRESYSNGKGYSQDSAFYSDESNVSSVGAVLSDSLNKNGINAIHISELYASGSIYGSKDEYENALTNALKKYPSIKYVFNVSRGIRINDDLSMNKSTTKSEARSLAQISIINGTNMDKSTENQTRGVLFALDFSKFANSKIENIIKENKISRFDLSQNFGPVSVNLDIGEYANTIDEAKNSAESLGVIFAEYLKNG